MKERTRVLIVGGDEGLRKLTLAWQATHAIDAIFAEDGLGALAWIAVDDGFDIVLSDEHLSDELSVVKLADTVAINLPRAKMIVASDSRSHIRVALAPVVTIISKAYQVDQLIALFLQRECPHTGMLVPARPLQGPSSG